MTVLVGPTPWWQAELVSSLNEGDSLPDGSRIICKNGGVAWIVAPFCTQVSSRWAGGQYNTSLVGDKCCICEWSTLETRLINCGFNPCDWFVPSSSQLHNPGYVCKTNWDSYCHLLLYWSSTEFSSTCAEAYACGYSNPCNKVAACCVRAFRCVTY